MSNGVILTYANLKENLLSECARNNDTSLESRLDFFILFAQDTLCKLLTILPTEKTVVGTLDPGISEIPKPTNWNKTVSFLISDPTQGNVIRRLQRYTTEYVENFSAEVGRLGFPLIYSEENIDSFLIAPAPQILENNQKYAYKIKYSILYEPLNDTVQTNVFTERFPALLNDACSYRMFLHLNAPDFKQQYMESMQLLVQTSQELDTKGLSDRSQNYSND